MKTITVCLGFNKNLEEAVATYVELFNNVFGNSKILGRSYFGEQEITALWQVPEMSEDIMPGAAGDEVTSIGV
jgi:predicted 3-demethylubiquinone-9 3-methyltransferase (glyoxalase superfamily)